MKSKSNKHGFVQSVIGFTNSKSRRPRFLFIVGMVGFLSLWVFFMVFYLPEAMNSVIILDKEEDLLSINGTYRWNVEDGWKYFVSPKHSPYHRILGNDQDVPGFWAWTANGDSSGHNKIQLEKFQLSGGSTSMEPVLLGIKLLVQGKTKVQVAFEIGSDIEFKYIEPTATSSSPQSENQDEPSTKSQLCVELLAPQINGGRINSIKISPYFSKESDSASDLIIIDKILITTGELETNKQLMYTLIPTGWCSKSKHFLKHLYA